MRRKTILAVIFFLSIFRLIGQEVSSENFLIITFERSYNKGSDGLQRFLWIIPESSLNEKTNLAPFYPIYISKNNYIRCLKGEKVSFYASDFSLYDTGERFQSNILEEENRLEKLIFDNKRKIFTVRKKWNSKLKEKIVAYVTPIKGEICNCLLYDTDSDLLNYEGAIYLPVSEVTYNHDFWKNSKLNAFLLTKISPLHNVSTIVGK